MHNIIRPAPSATQKIVFAIVHSTARQQQQQQTTTLKRRGSRSKASTKGHFGKAKQSKANEHASFGHRPRFGDGRNIRHGNIPATTAKNLRPVEPPAGTVFSQADR
jgi:hypothetical protein